MIIEKRSAGIEKLACERKRTENNEVRLEETAKEHGDAYI